MRIRMMIFVHFLSRWCKKICFFFYYQFLYDGYFSYLEQQMCACVCAHQNNNINHSTRAGWKKYLRNAQKKPNLNIFRFGAWLMNVNVFICDINQWSAKRKCEVKCLGCVSWMLNVFFLRFLGFFLILLKLSLMNAFIKWAEDVNFGNLH